MATIGPTSTIVLSPCQLYRHAWRSLLASLPFITSVMTAATVSEIVLPAKNDHSMTILVDAPGSEQRLARHLGSLCQGHHVLFVVNDYDRRTILPLLKLGVTGFTARGDSLSSFVETFRASSKGRIGLPPVIANRAMTELAGARRQYADLRNDMTQRETEVLQLLAAGMSNRDIAQSLFLSVRTVEAHLRNLYGKLDVNSRTEAALWAVHHGYASCA